MKTTRRRTAPWLLLLILAGGLCSGCRNEAYFGPYQLKVPTDINERSAGRTFLMPLSDSGRQQREQHASCEANEPQRAIPCRCDYPVLTVGRELTRLDYRLIHETGETANGTPIDETSEPVNVMVWIGVNVQPEMDLPNVLPDLPQVEVLSEHWHVIMPGAVLDEGFLESEWTEMEQAWTAGHFPECDGSIRERPAPYEIQIGLSLPVDSAECVTLEYTVRVRSDK